MNPSILFISNNNSLYKSFKQHIPDNTPCFLISPSARLLEEFASFQDKYIPVILLDTGVQDSNDIYHMLQSQSIVAHLPIIAIIDNLPARQTALNAGAHDYLLYPFVTQEVLARLSPYLVPSTHSSGFLLWALSYIKEGTPFVQPLAKNLDVIVTMTGAQAVHLYLYEEDDLATLIHIHSNSLERPFPIENELTKRLEQNILSPLENITISENNQGEDETWMSLALTSEEHRLGYLLFKFDAVPQWTSAKRQDLITLGTMIGNLLEISQLQQESQSYATQTGFMILVAKMLAEQSDLKHVLLMTLEHIVSMLNAFGGEIWLNASEEKALVLASDLTSVFSSTMRIPIPYGEGIVGQSFAQGETMQVNILSAQEALSAIYDAVYLDNGRYILAVPLYHQEAIGVVVVYHSRDDAFSNADIMLLQGIASLLAAAITNTQLVTELREYAEQQHVLYKMSRQIASGLDLQTTFNRSLGWATRLCNIEIGLLWLIDDSQKKLQLVAAHGLPEKSELNLTMHLDHSLVGLAVASNKPIVSNDPQHDSKYNNMLDAHLNISVQNMMVIPITYHQIIIGSLSLINKIGGKFTKADLTLITTASDMIAIAIGNAHLYTKTITLMDDRERLYQQTIQTERLATVGRLTASLAHEINNPMQAIKGAMTLALEELDDQEALQEYINLSIEQVDRVVQLVSRMRSIYRPSSDVPESISINQVIQEVVAISNKEMQRQNVRLQTHLAPNLPPIMVVNGHLQLVFLNIVLNLAESIGKDRSETIQIETKTTADKLQISFSTAVSNLPMPSLLKIIKENSIKETGFGLSFSQDIIIAYGGTLQLLEIEDQAIFQIEIPLL